LGKDRITSEKSADPIDRKHSRVAGGRVVSVSSYSKRSPNITLLQTTEDPSWPKLVQAAVELIGATLGVRQQMKNRSPKSYSARGTCGFMLFAATLLLAACGQGTPAATATLTPVSAQTTEGGWPIPADKYVFIERWIEVYQDSAVSAYIDFPSYGFDRDSGSIEPDIVPPGRWFPLEDLTELKVVYGRGTERTGSAGTGVNSQVFAVTALPFTEPLKGDTDVVVTAQSVDVQGIVYLRRGNERIVLRPGESWTRDGKSTVEWGGIKSEVLSRERISNHGVLDKSGIQVIEEAEPTSEPAR
jgi:hypothetical protein